MDRREVESIVREQVQELQVGKECPSCKRFCSMVKVYIEDDTEEGKILGGKTYFRCLGCLVLLEEKLEKVSE